MNNTIETYAHYNDIILSKKKDEMLLFLALKGCSYPTEIARQLNLQLDVVNEMIYSTKKDGFIDKITPDSDYPQPMFKGRMAELWAQGIMGYKNMTKFSWWFVTNSGVEYLKVKYKGQSKRIQKGLIDYLELEIDDKNN